MGSKDFISEVAKKLESMPEEERASIVESTQSNNRNGHDPISDAILPLNDLAENDSLAKVEDALRNLALSLDGFDSLRRAMVREAAIKRLEKVKISAPAKMVDAAFQSAESDSTEQQQGRPVLFDDPEPWPQAVDGSALLDDITVTLNRFIVLPPHAAEAVSLWILHACAIEAFTISPLLVINSPTKRSGKTLLLEVISCLLVKRLFASNITPATLFRAVDKYTPCLLIDEADTFLRDHDELRGILNASHRKASAFVLRTVGDEHEPAQFVTWCAKAIALIGKLPGTLEDRSILIPMKRRGPGERVERFRADKMGQELQTLKRKVMRWTNDNLSRLSKADPVAPGELNDRAMDNWLPLLAVSDLAGGAWPEKSRAAARTLSGAVDEGANSVAIQLLADLRTLFSERHTDRLSSAEICEALGMMEDRPWPEWKYAKPITMRQLAKLLGGFDVIPKPIRIGGTPIKGYTLEQLIDPFTRYLAPSSVTELQPASNVGLTENSNQLLEDPVTDGKMGKCAETKACNRVTDGNPLSPDFEEGDSEKPGQGVLGHESDMDWREEL